MDLSTRDFGEICLVIWLTSCLCTSGQLDDQLNCCYTSYTSVVAFLLFSRCELSHRDAGALVRPYLARIYAGVTRTFNLCYCILSVNKISLRFRTHQNFLCVGCSEICMHLEFSGCLYPLCVFHLRQHMHFSFVTVLKSRGLHHSFPSYPAFSLPNLSHPFI